MKVVDPAGYALLQCIACYLQYHLYISLDVHMESTLEAGEKVLSLFQERLDVLCSELQLHCPLTTVTGVHWSYRIQELELS